MKWIISNRKFLCLTAVASFLSAVSSAAQQVYSWEDMPPTLQRELEETGISQELFQQHMADRAERLKRERENSPAEEPPKSPSVAVAVQKLPEPIIVRPWPGSDRAVPLEVDTVSEFTDGFSEERLTFRSSVVSFTFRSIADLVFAPDQSGASARLLDRDSPQNQLEVFLFRQGVFLPSVTEPNLRGYWEGIEEEWGEDIRPLDEFPPIPRNTFKVSDNPWGQIAYETKPTRTGKNAVVEVFAETDGNILVFRISGSQEWVLQTSRRLQGSLSTFTLL